MEQAPQSWRGRGLLACCRGVAARVLLHGCCCKGIAVKSRCHSADDATAVGKGLVSTFRRGAHRGGPRRARGGKLAHGARGTRALVGVGVLRQGSVRFSRVLAHAWSRFPSEAVCKACSSRHVQAKRMLKQSVCGLFKAGSRHFQAGPLTWPAEHAEHAPVLASRGLALPAGHAAHAVSALPPAGHTCRAFVSQHRRLCAAVPVQGSYVKRGMERRQENAQSGP